MPSGATPDVELDRQRLDRPAIAWRSAPYARGRPRGTAAAAIGII
jgi:hypothetical protein